MHVGDTVLDCIQIDGWDDEAKEEAAEVEEE
jgi:hypothetical protein